MCVWFVFFFQRFNLSEHFNVFFWNVTSFKINPSYFLNSEKLEKFQSKKEIIFSFAFFCWINEMGILIFQEIKLQFYIHQFQCFSLRKVWKMELGPERAETNIIKTFLKTIFDRGIIGPSMDFFGNSNLRSFIVGHHADTTHTRTAHMQPL